MKLGRERRPNKIKWGVKNAQIRLNIINKILYLIKFYYINV